MADDTTIDTILRTKLYRPPSPGDYVHRPRLLEYLDQRRSRPLTLVSAPAGYGKSVLISSWLETYGNPSAWLSLDEQDNDLRLFLSYFLAAVNDMFPDAVSETKALVNVSTLPPVSVLARSLANELDTIEQDFILVLDDIHRIQEKSVYDFLTELLQHPPRPVHLVLTGRKDPKLPISSLRARNQVSEVRLFDLRFNTDETAAYLQTMLGEQIKEATAAILAEKTEGWITGLRLAVLAMRKHDNVVGKLLELKGTTVHVTEYLISEVMDSQPPAVRHYLLSTSILDRFCAPLCDALWMPDSERGEGEIDGAAFIAKLQNDNLFLIALDMENRWFRYHHLFQQLLKEQINQYQSPEKIADLHLRAAEWFEGQRLITEAIKQAQAAGNVDYAAEIVERYRFSELGKDRFYVVKDWLDMLPVNIKLKRPGLLLAQAWMAFFELNFEQVLWILERIDSMRTGKSLDSLSLGELHFFRGILQFYGGDVKSSIRNFKEVLAHLQGRQTHVLFRTEVHLAQARHMSGEKALAIQSLEDQIRTFGVSKSMHLPIMIGGLGWIYLLSGQLTRAKEETKRAQTFLKRSNIPNTEAWCDYLRACLDFHSNELIHALQHFAVAVEKRYAIHPVGAIQAFAGLALTQQLMRLPDDVEHTVKEFVEFAEQLNVAEYSAVVRSCKARLSLLQGDSVPAVRWAGSVDEIPAPMALNIWLEIPLITEARVLIAEGSEANLAKASELLHKLRQLSQTYRFTNQIIEIAVLQSLALEKQGRLNEALTYLEEVVALAGPLGWIRPFVEAGPTMAELLKRLHNQNVSVDYIKKIIAAFRDNIQVVGPKAADHPIASAHKPRRPSITSQSLVEPLTNRELDVLELLAKRLQNKEIADKLFISIETVKAHLKNIYQKLNVGKRREAVEKTKKLRIL